MSCPPTGHFRIFLSDSRSTRHLSPRGFNRIYQVRTIALFPEVFAVSRISEGIGGLRLAPMIRGELRFQPTYRACGVPCDVHHRSIIDVVGRARQTPISGTCKPRGDRISGIQNEVWWLSKNGGIPGLLPEARDGFELPVPHQSRHAHYLLRPVPSEIVLQAGIRLARAAYYPLTLSKTCSDRGRFFRLTRLCTTTGTNQSGLPRSPKVATMEST
jgi:hypothetical protein